MSMRREVLASLSPAYSTNGWGHTVTNFGVPDAERGSTADAMNARLSCLRAEIVRVTMKVQVNGGDGGCFPIHFDSDPRLDGRLVTAILYLNDEPRGGQLRLYVRTCPGCSL